jgi:hypothetical protein
LQLGTGLLYLKPVNSTNVYVGVRGGILRTTSSYSYGSGQYDDDNSNTAYYIGPVTGAEHMFGDHFSLGGEFQISYSKISDGDSSETVSLSSIASRSIFFVRWHF